MHRTKLPAVGRTEIVLVFGDGGGIGVWRIRMHVLCWQRFSGTWRSVSCRFNATQVPVPRCIALRCLLRIPCLAHRLDWYGQSTVTDLLNQGTLDAGVSES